MDIRCLRQRRRIDFDDRSEQHELPFAAFSSRTSNEIPIEPLIEHAKEADPRMGNARLIGGIGHRARPRGREMRNVNATGKWVNVAVQVFFGFVETAAAGEDHTSASQKRALQVTKTRWSSGEIREFIHAVVNDRLGLHMVAEPQRHRCVVPQHVRSHAFPLDDVIEQRSLDRGLVRAICFPQMRHDNVDVRLRLGDGRVRALDRVKMRFFEEKNTSVSGGPAQQMLRTLEHKIPAQMRKAD